MSRYVYYVNVGKMPKAKAEEFIEDLKQHTMGLGFFNPEDKVLFVGVRENEKTRIEWLGD